MVVVGVVVNNEDFDIVGIFGCISVGFVVFENVLKLQILVFVEQVGLVQFFEHCNYLLLGFYFVELKSLELRVERGLER